MDFIRRLVPGVIRRRYAVKFGIALLVLGLSVGAIGFVATAGITDQVEQRVQDDHASSANQEARNLQMWNQQNEHTVGMIAYSDVVESRDEAAVQNRFLNWQTHIDADTFAITYVDTDEAQILASTDNRVRGESTDALELSDSVYDEASADLPWISKPYVTDDELGQKSAVVTYVLQVPQQDDRAIVYTAELDAYATQFEEDSGTTTMVLDGDDEVMLDNVRYGEEYETLGLAYDGPESVLQTARTEGTGSQRIAASPSGALTHQAYDFGDEEYVAGYAPVIGTDWVVVIHEPTDQAYGFVNTVDEYGTMATVAGVLLIGMVGAVLGRNTAVSIDRLTEKAARMEAGDLDVDFETERVDNIGRLYAGFASMRDALREQIEEANAARNEAEVERKRVQEINDDLERKAADYSTVMEAAADGDLTARMDVESDNEAMEEIAREFNEMLAEIETTVAELNEFATDVATASEQVTASSEEVRSASQQVTGSIQEISDGAERQNDSLQSVNQEMSALSTTTEEIAASSNEVADIAEQTAETGRGGQEAARRAIDAMDEIETGSEQTVEEFRQLVAEVQQIDELIASISEIANQTNMLALNANIEASRSARNSDDDGFTVVAQEVKQLSEDVKQAAEEAEERLESIREQTEQSAEEVQRTSAEIDDAGEQVQEAVDALEEIAEYARETNVGVQEISAASEEQAASTQEVVAMVDDAATISEETTSEAENVAAAAEEQTTALTEVSRSASDLAEQASHLSEALDRFETGVETGERVAESGGATSETSMLAGLETEPTSVASESTHDDGNDADPVDDPTFDADSSDAADTAGDGDSSEPIVDGEVDDVFTFGDADDE